MTYDWDYSVHSTDGVSPKTRKYYETRLHIERLGTPDERIVMMVGNSD